MTHVHCCDEVDAEAAFERGQATIDVERLAEALDADRVEALGVMRKHGYVFARDLAAVNDDSDEAARWEKLAFTLYTMLLPSMGRVQRIAAEYARLTGGQDE